MVKNETDKTSVFAKINEFSSIATLRLLMGMFVLFALLFLGAYNAEYLYKLQNQSLFLKNELFANEIICQTGGLLIYVSRYILQYCYYPLLGAFLIVCGYLLLTKMLIVLSKATTLASKSLCALPVLFVMISQTSLGYALYDNCEISFVISFELGLLISLVLTWIYKRVMRLNTKFGLILAFGASTLLHLAIGVYGPFSLLVLAVGAVRKNVRIAFLDFALFVMALFLGASLTSEIYGDFLSASLFAPFINYYYLRPFLFGLIAVVTVLCMAAGVLNSLLEKKLSTNVSLLLFAVFSFAVCYFASYRNANFRTELKLQHLTETQDWDGVLEEVKSVERPTQGIAAYRILALDHKDLLAKELFNFPVRFEKIDSEYKDIWIGTYYPDYFFYMSQVDLSLMWSMELWTATGRNFSLMKRFLQAALIKGETATAKKYIDLLKQTTFHASWAKDHEQYLSNPHKYVENNKTLLKVAKCQPRQNINVTTSGLTEILRSYNNLDSENFQRRLLLGLYENNVDKFLEDLMKARGLYAQLPECMQEVIILYAMKTNRDLTKVFPVSRAVYERVVSFEGAASNFVDKPEEGAVALKKYQGSSLYHLLFGNPTVESL